MIYQLSYQLSLVYLYICSLLYYTLYIINKNLHGYSLQITDNKIEVFEDESDLTKGVYYFVNIAGSDLNFRLDNSEETPKQIVISKINDEIRISESVPQLS